MKWERTIVVFDKGGIAQTEEWCTFHDSYVNAIRSVDFPRGSGELVLRPKAKNAAGKWDRNGVKYLKERFVEAMRSDQRWTIEDDFTIHTNLSAPDLRRYPGLEAHAEPVTGGFGEFDFAAISPTGFKIAVEWETGNISSSHRSLNKLTIALSTGQVAAGVLIIPTRALYRFLTDRIGNVNELSPYLRFWNQCQSQVYRGLLAITVVEHDRQTDNPNHPLLPRGNDGNAARGAE